MILIPTLKKLNKGDTMKKSRITLITSALLLVVPTMQAGFVDNEQNGASQSIENLKRSSKTSDEKSEKQKQAKSHRKKYILNKTDQWPTDKRQRRYTDIIVREQEKSKSLNKQKKPLKKIRKQTTKWAEHKNLQVKSPLDRAFFIN
jgi:hypothetical protein